MSLEILSVLRILRVDVYNSANIMSDRHDVRKSTMIEEEITDSPRNIGSNPPENASSASGLNGNGKNVSSPGLNGNASYQGNTKLSPAKVKIEIMNAEGGCYWAKTLAEKLDIDEQQVETLRQENKIIGLPIKEGGFVYPKWQFVLGSDGHYKPLDGLDRVLALLRYSGPWGKAAFMLDRHISDYITTPLDGLREGKIDLVLEVAEGRYTQGAA